MTLLKRHKPEDCPFKGVAEDNNIEPPYCNKCIEKLGNLIKKEEVTK